MSASHRVARRWIGPATALATASACLGAPAPHAGAVSLRVEVVKRISSGTPFPGPCARDSPIVTIDAEVEPHIAVDPRNPRHLVVVWTQDSGRSNVTLVSRDGRRSWARALVPRLSACTGGAEQTAADPWLSFGARGSLYLGSVVGVIPTTTQPVTAMVASRSSDGGGSWRTPSVVQRRTGAFWDKPTITADPRHAGRAYVVFDRRIGADATAGLSYLSRTRDGGRTWSRRRVVFNPRTTSSWPASNLLSVLRDGTLLDVGFLYGINTKRVRFLAQRSRDHGRTWSRPRTIATAPNRQPQGPAGAVVNALALPSSALAPDGSVYVVWADLRSAGLASVRLSRSRDGGRRWSRPRTVARVAGQAFVPAVAVAGDGTVGVMYYGTQRDRPTDPAWTTDVWFSYSFDRGRSWRTRRLAGPFDLNTAERGGGQLFLGDYEGLAGLPHGFAAAFAQARPRATNGPSDVFFARIRTRR